MSRAFVTSSCHCLSAGLGAVILSAISAGCAPLSSPTLPQIPIEQVGLGQRGEALVPVNQRLTPAGTQVELPGLRPQVLRLSPDRKRLLTSGKNHELIVIDSFSGNILQQVPFPSDKSSEPLPEAVSSHILAPDKEGQASYTGLIFSRDGSRVYLSNVNGNIKVFSVGPTGLIDPLHTIALPETGLKDRKADIPSGLALSRDGRRLYVALNLSNQLLELDLATGKPLRRFPTGVAPYDVVLAGTKAYVSNWGGRRPDATSTVGPAGRGTRVRVDPVRFIAKEGSVSVIDLSSGKSLPEILAGLHSSALALSPDGRYLFVANAAGDSVTVIATQTDQAIETISLRWHSNDFFGASPNALICHPNGKTLYVCNGTQNAVAMIAFKPAHSRLLALIPTGWFPGAIDLDAKAGRLYVANIKGFGSGKRLQPGEKIKFNSHQYFGTLSLIPLPLGAELKRNTSIVLRNYQRAVAELAALPPRPQEPPRPVPERPGEPSLHKHVIYIIKENRTYDQVFGDMRQGNGDPDLCVFGETITPNQHKICREFALLDNTYCSGILSADGHQWTDSAFATDYIEKSFAGFPRSYPDGMEDKDIDALAYAPTGFLWDNAIAHGRTFRDYGEFTIGITQRRGAPSHAKPLAFADFYRDFVQHTDAIEIGCRPAIASLARYISTNTIGWNLDVPDQFRAARFIEDLRQFERAGQMPELIFISLPNDHTSGTRADSPTPAAQVADNDLAFGKIVDAVSHSSFWKDTCILAIEDDPQAGWDHVSGYRTTAYAISPYVRRGAVIHHNYNQTSLVRTIELMLGLPAMNQLDATATPMSACFTNVPNLAPFRAVPNQVPLDQMNPPAKAILDPVLKKDAIVSARLPLEKPDQCREDVLNRILWHAQKGSRAPYPQWAITPVEDDD